MMLFHLRSHLNNSKILIQTEITTDCCWQVFSFIAFYSPLENGIYTKKRKANAQSTQIQNRRIKLLLLEKIHK